MSAGRKKGDPLDRYDTPPEVTRAFLAAWGGDLLGALDVLEPAAGSGALLGPLAECWPMSSISAWDIEPRMDEVAQWDFLTETPNEDDGEYDVVITNPPFRLAEQFLRWAMIFVRPGGYVVLLLRAGFLESKARRNVLTQYPPLEVWFLRSRPKFTGPNTDGGTDTAMYAWFVWRKGDRPDHFEGRII